MKKWKLFKSKKKLLNVGAFKSKKKLLNVGAFKSFS